MIVRFFHADSSVVAALERAVMSVPKVVLLFQLQGPRNLAFEQKSPIKEVLEAAGERIDVFAVIDEGSNEGMWRDPVGNICEKAFPDKKDQQAAPSAWIFLEQGRALTYFRKSLWDPLEDAEAMTAWLQQLFPDIKPFVRKPREAVAEAPAAQPKKPERKTTPVVVRAAGGPERPPSSKSATPAQAAQKAADPHETPRDTPAVDFPRPNMPPGKRGTPERPKTGSVKVSFARPNMPPGKRGVQRASDEELGGHDAAEDTIRGTREELKATTEMPAVGKTVEEMPSVVVNLDGDAPAQPPRQKTPPVSAKPPLRRDTPPVPPRAAPPPRRDTPPVPPRAAPPRRDTPPVPPKAAEPPAAPPPVDVPMNPYQVLGIQPGVTFEDAKKAYRALMMQYHPDKVSHLGAEFRDLAEKKTRELNVAFQMIEKALKG